MAHIPITDKFISLLYLKVEKNLRHLHENEVRPSRVIWTSLVLIQIMGELFDYIKDSPHTCRAGKVESPMDNGLTHIGGYCNRNYVIVSLISPV